MNNLKIIKHNNILMVDSRDVAEMVDKPHDQLMRSIRTYIEYMAVSYTHLTLPTTPYV